MARLPAIDFLNWRDQAGYCLLEVKPPELGRVVRKDPNNAKLVPSRPLAETDELFLIFARTAVTPEGVLDFVQQYGPLTKDGNGQGDLLHYVIMHARNMQLLLDTISTRKPPALRGEFEVAPGSTLYAVVVWDPLTKSPKWELHPSSLLDGLWLQFGQSVTRGAQIQPCAHCGNWFEAGRGIGRRAGSKFCSEEHK